MKAGCSNGTPNVIDCRARIGDGVPPFEAMLGHAMAMLGVHVQHPTPSSCLPKLHFDS